MCQGPNAIPLSRKSKENGFQLFSVRNLPHPAPPTSVPTLIECIYLFQIFHVSFPWAVLLFRECGPVASSPNKRKPIDLVLEGAEKA